MFKAGIGLYDCFTELEKGFPDPSFSLAIDRAAQDLYSGISLSEALRRQDGWFEPFIISLLRVGEESGSLHLSFNQVSEMLEERVERRQNIVSALSYPLCLFLVMCFVCVIFVVFVAPTDGDLMGTLGNEAPLPSVVLFQISQLLSSKAFWIGFISLALVGVALFRRVYYRSSDFRLFLHTSILKTPVFGPLVGSLETARTTDILARCLTLGVALVTSLRLASDASSNLKRRQEIQEVVGAIVNGETLAEALRSKTTFDSLSISLLEVGEESGKLSTMAAKAAEMLSEDSNQKIDTAVALIEPTLLCLGGAVAGFIAVAAFLPILSLINKFA